MDYAFVHLYGRATGDAKLYNIGSEDGVSRAVFDVAMNIPIRKDGQYSTKAIFRRVIAWAHYADYIASCQESDPDGLKGRVISIAGTMDNEVYADGSSREIIRVGSPHGIINVIDRRTKEDD